MTAIELGPEELKTILQSVSDGVVCLEADGRIRFINRSAERILGVEADEIAAPISTSNLWELVREDGSHCPEEDNPFYMTMATGQALNEQVRGVVMPDQTVSWLSINTLPLFKCDQEMPEAVVILFSEISERMTFEDFLNERRAGFQSIFETNQAPKLLIDPDNGKIVHANEAACRFYGYSRPELTAMKIYDLNTLSAAKVKSEMDRAKSEDCLFFSFRHRLKSGEIRDVEVYSGPMVERGRTLLLSIISDVTKRKRAEEELRRSNERLAEAQRIGGMGDWDWDPASDTVTWSENLYYIFGMDPKQPPPEYERQLALYHLDDAKRLNEKVSRCLEEGAPYELEMRRVNPDGRQIHVLVRGVSEKDETGKVKRVYGSVQDITAQKQIENEYRKSEEKYRYLIENSTDIIWTYDLLQGKYSFVAGALNSILGYAPSEAIGFTLDDIFDANTKNLVENEFRKSIENKEKSIIKVEARHRHKNHEYIWLEIFAWLQLDKHGNPMAFSGVSRDITRRKQSEEALRRANRDLEALWSVVTLEDASLKDISDHILETVASMTDSEYGFFGFMDGEEKTMTIHSWNSRAMLECSVVNQPLHFPIDQAGVWAEAVRRRTPLIINDFSVDHPGMKGMPPGHVELRNLLVVPFLSHDKILSLAAVANRNRDYTSDDATRINSFLASAQTVIDRKRAERALRSSEDHLAAAQRIAHVGSWDWISATDKVTWSRELYHILGVDSDKPAPSMAEQDSFYTPESTERMRTSVAKTMQTGESYEVELEYVPKDGSHKFLLSRGERWYDEKGELIGLRGTALDITERKKAEEELRQSKALLDATGRMARVGGWELNAETQEVTWTEETHRIHEVPLDYKPPLEEAINFWHPDDRGRLTQAIQLALDKGKAYDLELRFITAKGRRLWARTACLPEVVEGRTVRLRGTFQDITERKEAELDRVRLEAQLRQAQKMEAIGTLAGGIAHDFNNILAAIIGFTELTLEDTPAGMPTRSNLEQIYKSALRARDLVRQILSFSRQTEHEKRPLNVEPIVKETLKLLRATIPTTIDIRQDIAPDIGPVEGDPTQIHQLILNLGTNAADAMKETGGTLAVKLEDARVDYKAASGHSDLKAGRYLKITVQDTGPGIPAEIADRIFEPFFTTKEVGAGTGLGLSVVHGIVHSLDGAITVDGGLDRGALFTIYLPVVEAEVIQNGTEANRDIIKGTGRILFVDDEEMVSDLAKLMLTRLGYEPIVKTSSLEALEIFKAAPGEFDLVMTDMAMPKMRGDALAKEVLNIRPDIPVLLCTGYSDRIDEEKAKDIGVAKLLLKPLSLSVVSRILHELLGDDIPD